jgi:hypothetical protein
MMLLCSYKKHRFLTNSSTLPYRLARLNLCWLVEVGAILSYRAPDCSGAFDNDPGKQVSISRSYLVKQTPNTYI